MRRLLTFVVIGFAAWTPKGFDGVWERFIDRPGPDYAAVQATPRENHYVAIEKRA